MTTRYWLGTATAVAQVTTVQVTAYDAATTYHLTVGVGDRTEVVSVVGDTDVNTTATNLAAAWEASTHPYCVAATAGATTDTVTITADVAGVPFTVASSVTAGTGTIGAASTSTASAGPNDWSTAENWSDGTVPIAADDVILSDSAGSIAWGLAQSGVTLDSLTIRQSYTGRIGLRQTEFATSIDAVTTDVTKPEYREDYLDIGATVIDVGEDFGSDNPTGSGRIKIDNAKAGGSTLTVHNTSGTPADTGLPALRYLAAHASANVYVRAAPAGVGVAVDKPDETSTIGLMSVSHPSVLAFVHTGPGVTLTTWEQKGGRNTIESAATVTTITVEGGTLTLEGAFAVTTLNVYAGIAISNTAGTIVAVNIDGGELDCKRSTEARTITAVNLTGGALLGNDALTITTLNEPTAKDYAIQVT